MTTTTELPAPITAAPAARPTFIRVGDKKRVTAMVKEARRVGYTVTSSGDFSHRVTDPTNKDALVFKSVCMRPGQWATTYATAYFVENT